MQTELQYHRKNPANVWTFASLISEAEILRKRDEIFLAARDASDWLLPRRPLLFRVSVLLSWSNLFYPPLSLTASMFCLLLHEASLALWTMSSIYLASLGRLLVLWLLSEGSSSHASTILSNTTLFIVALLCLAWQASMAELSKILF